MREVILVGDVEEAIDNANRLEKHFEAEGKTMYSDINTMSPYTTVHKLIEQFLAEISCDSGV